MENKYYINEDYSGNVAPITKDQSKILLSQLEKCVCKIFETNGNKGTGFLCKIPYPNQFSLLPVLITCKHVLSQKDLNNNKYIKVTFDDDKFEKNLNLKLARKVFENEALDTFIIEIKPNFDKIFDFLDIDENIFDNNYIKNYMKLSAYVLQYPKGCKSSYSVGLINDISDININHFCATDFGSSGSPILNLSNFKVFGVHKRRTKLKFNQGTFIKFVIEQFNKENISCKSQIKDRNLNNKNNEKTFNNNSLDNSYNIINNSINNNCLNLKDSLFAGLMQIDDIILIKYLGGSPLIEFYLSTKKGENKNLLTKRISRQLAEAHSLKLKNIKYEISVLKCFNHPNIVKLKDIKKTKSHYYILLEYINGGTLSNCLKKYMEKYGHAFSEEIIQYLMRQIIDALICIHKKNIIHKNLSLQNIMINFDSDYDKLNLNMLKSKIKIIHFHEGVDLIENDLTNISNLKKFQTLDPYLLNIFLKTHQLNSLKYDNKMDIWSLGTILYILLTGKYAFEINSMKDLNKILNGVYTVPKTISKESVAFLNEMLRYNPSDRLNAEQLSHHPFLKKNILNFKIWNEKKKAE